MIQQPYFIQRLLKPYHDFTNNPFSFGGGLVNGGFSDEAMNTINKVFRFDYMGSAEFEWGAIPKSLSRIYTNAKVYTTIQFKLLTKEDNSSWIYVICNDNDLSDIELYLKGKAYDEYDKKYHTKEYVGLQDAINKKREDIMGWLDITNDFFFFINKDMFDKTQQLIRV